jgi:NitT/TauT family transport system substrate-binding protein
MRLVPAPARTAGLRIILVSVSAALLLSGCRVPGTSSQAGAAGSQTVTVAVVGDGGKGPLSVADAPLRVAAADGLFKQHGLNVVVKTYPTTADVVHALSSGDAQIAAGDYTGFLYQQNTGALKLHLIADGYDAAPNMMEVLTLPSSRITTPQQLAGATVATPEPAVTYPASSSSLDTSDLPYNIETLATETVLQDDGVSPSSVHWKPTPLAQMIGDLKSGKVQAILAPEPYVFQAESQLGAQEVLDSSSGAAAGLPLSGYFSLAKYASANPSAVQSFRTALLQAQANSGMRAPVQAVLPSATGMTAQDAALVTLGTYPTSLSVGQVQRVAQLMFDSGMIGNTLNVRRMVSG